MIFVIVSLPDSGRVFVFHDDWHEVRPVLFHDKTRASCFLITCRLAEKVSDGATVVIVMN